MTRWAQGRRRCACGAGGRGGQGGGGASWNAGDPCRRRNPERRGLYPPAPAPVPGDQAGRPLPERRDGARGRRRRSPPSPSLASCRIMSVPASRERPMRLVRVAHGRSGRSRPRRPCCATSARRCGTPSWAAAAASGAAGHACSACARPGAAARSDGGCERGGRGRAPARSGRSQTL